MSRNMGPFIDIVRLEDKETKLKSFIRTVVEQSDAHAASTDGERFVLLIARSVDSPVAKAVAALVREGTITGPVKAILALVPRPDPTSGVNETLTALVGAHGGRLVRDSRLFDAHEQIVLGPASSWVGDCMRRDPMKRDAFECFAADCSKTAGWAKTSFDRLWNICEAMPHDLSQLVPAEDPACPHPIPTDDASGSADPVGSSST